MNNFLSINLDNKIFIKLCHINFGEPKHFEILE